MPGDSTVVRLSPPPLVSLDVVSFCGMVVMMGRFDCNGRRSMDKQLLLYGVPT